MAKTYINTKFMFLVGIVLALLFVLNYAGLFSTFQIQPICEVKDSNGIALVPYYGYYSCEPISHVEKYNSLSLPAKDNQYSTTTTIECGDDEFISGSCGGVSVFCEDSDRVVFQADGTDYPIGGDNWAETSVNRNTFTAIITKMEKGERVKFRGCLDRSFLTSKYTSGVVRSYYIPYGLVQYERGQPSTISTINCNIPSSSDLCIDCIIPSLNIDSGVSRIETNPVRSLMPEQKSTYVKDWLLSPVESSTYRDNDNTDVFCSNRQVYNSDTIRLESGCYLIPKSSKRLVECCPGDKLNQYTFCGSDFKWQEGDLGCIVGGIQSIVNCNGGGRWYSSGSTTYQKATQCNNDGTCTYTTIEAECTAPDIGCPDGSVCQIDINNPRNNKCVGNIISCGDSDGNCYDDCTKRYIDGCIPIKDTCELNTDCNDGNFLTLDTCEGLKIGGIDTGLDKKCVNTDITFWLFVGIILFVLIFIVIILILLTPSGKITRRKR